MKQITGTKIIRIAVVTMGVIMVALYLILPVSMGIFAVSSARSNVGPPPEGFSEVTLQTSDGQSLAAWYLPPENGAVVLLFHGAGSSREEVRPYAEMLAENGFGVLAVDLRGHGLSTGKTNRLGWYGTADVGAAVNYLAGREEVEQILGLGLSMGGEVLLGAASAYPEIRAMAADGATRRSTEELLALPSERSLVRSFTARVMYSAVQVLSGDAPPSPPLLDSMMDAENTRFLWIAAGMNGLEVAFNQLFAETIGSRGSLWVVPDVGHTGAFHAYPDAYEERVIEFFTNALLVK